MNTSKRYFVVERCVKDGEKKVHELNKSKVLLGRNPNYFISVSSPTASRCHASLEFIDNKWMLTDNNSVNGTYIYGLRLAPGVPYPLENAEVFTYAPPDRASYVFQYLETTGGSDLIFHSMVETVQMTEGNSIFSEASVPKTVKEGKRKSVKPKSSWDGSAASSSCCNSSATQNSTPLVLQPVFETIQVEESSASSDTPVPKSGKRGRKNFLKPEKSFGSSTASNWNFNDSSAVQNSSVFMPNLVENNRVGTIQVADESSASSDTPVPKSGKRGRKKFLKPEKSLGNSTASNWQYDNSSGVQNSTAFMPNIVENNRIETVHSAEESSAFSDAPFSKSGKRGRKKFMNSESSFDCSSALNRSNDSSAIQNIPTLMSNREVEIIQIPEENSSSSDAPVQKTGKKGRKKKCMKSENLCDNSPALNVCSDSPAIQRNAALLPDLEVEVINLADANLASSDASVPKTVKRGGKKKFIKSKGAVDSSPALNNCCNSSSAIQRSTSFMSNFGENNTYKHASKEKRTPEKRTKKSVYAESESDDDKTESHAVDDDPCVHFHYTDSSRMNSSDSNTLKPGNPPYKLIVIPTTNCPPLHNCGEQNMIEQRNKELAERLSQMETKNAELSQELEASADQLNWLQECIKEIVAKNESYQNQRKRTIEHDLTCSICADLFVMPMTMNCGHTFCKLCIRKWIKKSSACPICRRKIVHVSNNITIDSVVSELVESSSDDVKEKYMQAKETKRKENEILNEEDAIPDINLPGPSGVNTRNSQPIEIVLLSSDSDSDVDFDLLPLSERIARRRIVTPTEPSEYRYCIFCGAYTRRCPHPFR